MPAGLWMLLLPPLPKAIPLWWLEGSFRRLLPAEITPGCARLCPSERERRKGREKKGGGETASAGGAGASLQSFY